MVDDTDLRQQVLQSTLDEVASRRHGDSEPKTPSDPCVICLDQVSEKAIAEPCRHASFDFLCLVSWLQQQPSCPLCKTDVVAVQYGDGKVYRVDGSSQKAESIAAHDPQRPPLSSIQRRGPPTRRRRFELPAPPSPSDAISRRKHVYRHGLYSLRVGSNRLSKFKELAPREFHGDEELVSRARKWIRRELQVFEFLNTDTAEESPQRRVNNAEFLLEYIVAILKTVDIKGSGGQAEDLLQEFLGRENTRLFLHELQAWLRSPYNSLEDWDRAVQYDETEMPVKRRESEEQHPRRADTYRPTYSSRPHRSYTRPSHVSPGAVQKLSRAGSSRGRHSIHDSALSRRIETAQRRYEPD